MLNFMVDKELRSTPLEYMTCAANPKKKIEWSI